jgi:predicted ATPase
VAVQVIVVPVPCGTGRFAPSITAVARTDEIGGAKVDDVLSDIRAAFSKAQARIVIARKKSDRGCYFRGETGSDAGRERLQLQSTAELQTRS